MFLIAELSGFFKTLIIILLVYYTLRFFLKLAWPFIVSYITKKAHQKMQSTFKGFQNQSQDVHNVKPQVSKKKKEVVGEYVDYEEID